jgi:hypothetical protein
MTGLALFLSTKRSLEMLVALAVSEIFGRRAALDSSTR